jgi:hypothetical protein
VDAGAAMVLSVGSMYCWAFCTKFEMLNMASGRPKRQNERQICCIGSLFMPHDATRIALVKRLRETGALCRAALVEWLQRTATKRLNTMRAACLGL